jgi:LysM repeat protein
MITPVSAVRGQGPPRASLQILGKKGSKNPVIPLRFNPTEYQLQKTNHFAEIPIFGQESPAIQFVRGGSEKLSAELLVDTSDTLEDVRVRYVDKLRGLMKFNGETHEPPVVRLTWDRQIFVGVLESLNITYVLFTPEGVPLRAKLSVVLKEYRPVVTQVKENPKSSPDFDKTYVVRRGDTLSSVAAAVYSNAEAWREIARANQIQDPRQLQPGRVLLLPRLR